MDIRRFMRTAALCAGVWLALALPAQAYIDPGAGGLIFQGVIGAVAVGLLFIRNFWTKLKLAVRRLLTPRMK